MKLEFVLVIFWMKCQLSLEIETRRTSRSSTTTSTLPGIQELPVSSYPVFNNPKPKCKRVSSSDILPISTGCELQVTRYKLFIYRYIYVLIVL